MRNCAPIVAFAYKRPDHFKRTIEALKKNELAGESDLFIFVDGPRDMYEKEQVQRVLQIARSTYGFRSKNIIEREEHRGLANSIIAGIAEIITNYGQVIVVEDDLVTSPFFLNYLNDGLDFYRNDGRVFSISAYTPPFHRLKIPSTYKDDVYFCYRNSSWGFATWDDRWKKVDWEMKDYPQFKRNIKERLKFNLGGDDLTEMLDAQMKGENDSWSIRFTYAHFKNNAVSVCPVVSFVDNIGRDGSGTHCGPVVDKDRREIALNTKNKVNFPTFVKINLEIMARFRNVYKFNKRYKLRRFVKAVLG